MKKYIFYAMVFLVVSAIISGCGGSSRTSNATSSENGSLSLRITWPDSKEIPSTVTTIKIDVYSQGTSEKVVPTTEVTRNSSESTVSKTINGIPIGKVTVEAKGYNSNGSLLASASQDATILKGDNSGITLTLSSHFDNVVALMPVTEKSSDETITQKVMCGASTNNTVTQSPTVNIGGATYSLDYSSSPQIATVTDYYYVGCTATYQPEQTVTGPVNINFAQSTAYGKDITSLSSPYGSYAFSFNNLSATVNCTLSTFPALVSGVSAETYYGYDRTEKTIASLYTDYAAYVSWTSAGSNYKYFVTVSQGGSDNASARYWSSADLRTLNTTDPDTFTTFLNGITSTTYAYIPANIFQSGTVDISIFAVDSTHFNVDKTGRMTTYIIPFSQYIILVTYMSAG